MVAALAPRSVDPRTITANASVGLSTLFTDVYKPILEISSEQVPVFPATNAPGVADVLPVPYDAEPIMPSSILTRSLSLTSIFLRRTGLNDATSLSERRICGLYR